MKKTPTPIKTPLPSTEKSNTTNKVGSENNPLSALLIASLNMSWQLAIVVLVPILGGFTLDKKLNAQPYITIVGFIIAIIGTVMVIRHQLQLFGPPPRVNNKEHRS
jgi:F0F1-type ATP synthase assembly protein I